MKKTTILICILCLLLSMVPAGAEEVQWAEMFGRDANELNRALALQSGMASNHAYSPSGIRNYLIGNGFEEDSVRQFDYQTDADHSAAVTFARRKMEDDKNPTLYAIVIRGTMTLQEGISNFMIGTGDTVEGFRLAAERVMDHWQDYLQQFPPHEGTTEDGRYSLWICGHSRGGAVANILAGQLLPANILRERTYVYTFGTPLVVRQPEYRENIFNFVIDGDLLASLPPAAWGFGRYGQDIHYNDVKVNHIRINTKNSVNRFLDALLVSGLNQQSYNDMLPVLMEKTETDEMNIYAIVSDVLLPLIQSATTYGDEENRMTWADCLLLFANMMPSHLMSTYLEWMGDQQ